jgi:WS/DGAT/MGAT family acyltransferase
MRAPLRNVDASWLRMDDPTNLMVVTGVLVLDHPVPLPRLRALLKKRLLRFRRFTSRVVQPAGGVGTPTWESDPDFSLARHLKVAKLKEPAGERELQAYVSGLLGQPFPPHRPLWSFHFIPRYQGGSAIVARIHHCIGDGLALVHVLLSMADGTPEPEGEAGADLPWDEHGEEGPVARTASWAITLPRLVRDGAGELLEHPGRLTELALLASGSAASLVNVLALPPDPSTAFKGPLSVAKKAAWSRAFDLEEFKAIGQVAGSTVNDILMAGLAGGLRRYLLGRGEVPRDLDVRGVVPVNLRPPEESDRLGNRFGLVFLPLPLGIEDPLDRLFEVRRRMRELKNSPQALAIYQLLWVMGVAPKPVFDLVLEIFASKGTAVVTNVVGPRTPISIAGAPLRQAMFWVPSAGRLAMGVSLLSYAGKVWMGLQVDAGLVPDPDVVLQGFEAEVGALLQLRRDAGG